MFEFNDIFIWNYTFFFLILYIAFFVSFLLYTLPNIHYSFNLNRLNSFVKFLWINAIDLNFFFFTIVGLIFILNYSWTSYYTTPWGGHLNFSSFQQKMFYIIISLFIFCLTVYSSIFYFGTTEINDYYTVIFNFFIWLYLLFCANTIFTIVFILEILTTLIFLLTVTSTFASTYFYKNTKFNLNVYFTDLLTSTYFLGLLFFFWISLLASLGLFLFLVFFYLIFYNFEGNVNEILFYLLITTNSYASIFKIFVSFSFLFFCIFLKCGLVPFYFWKPVFFKGLPTHSLFFYIVFYYFFIFIYFTLFLLFILSEIFYFFIFLFNLFLIFGITLIFCMLCEAFYFKVFLAMSSILNTLLVFITFVGLTPIVVDYTF